MPGPTSPRSTPVPYDFRRPNKFTREHVRALQIVNETFARQFTTVLSTALRSVCQVSMTAVGPQTYDEYIRDVPNPSYLAVLGLAPLSGSALFHIPLPVVMAAVDRLLGGSAEGTMPSRALTDIEASLIRDLLVRVLRELSYAFESLVTGLDPEVRLQESNPQFAQVAAATDMVVVCDFDIRIGAQHGRASLCIPFSSLQPVLDEVGERAGADAQTGVDAAGVRSALSDRLGGARVPVSIRFAEITLSSAEIVELRAGDVIPLHHPVESPLTVSVDGVDRFTAVPGRRGQRMACVVVERTEPDQPLFPRIAR